MSDLQRNLMKSKLPSKPLTGSANRLGRKDYSPVLWNTYFTSRDYVRLANENVFRIYKSESDTSSGTRPCLFLLHGAGYSGLTWASFASEIVGMIECTVVALDIRGHGESFTDNENDLSIETMTSDVNGVYSELFKEETNQPPVVLIGHSMGGALAVHVALSNQIPSIAGLTVIDVVEGTALDALQGMQTLLRSRPKSFPTLSRAVEWSCRSGQTRNIESAKVSMPAMLKRMSDGRAATFDIEESQATSEDSLAPTQHTCADGIPEDAETDIAVPPQKQEGYTWRIDLSKSEPHWNGWFKSLSSSFLSIPCPKLLLLAGVDRLDKELTIGQMQGKFQTQVLPKVGHAVHEDAPLKVAEAIAAFVVRNKICEKIGSYDEAPVCC